LDKLNDELKDVTKVMTKNIEDLLYRGDSLERMGDISSRLREDSRKYKKAAVRINWELLLKQVRYQPGVWHDIGELTRYSTAPLEDSRLSSSSSSGGDSSRCCHICSTQLGVATLQMQPAPQNVFATSRALVGRTIYPDPFFATCAPKTRTIEYYSINVLQDQSDYATDILGEWWKAM
jgi:hypothetical protein